MLQEGSASVCLHTHTHTHTHCVQSDGRLWLLCRPSLFFSESLAMSATFLRCNVTLRDSCVLFKSIVLRLTAFDQKHTPHKCFWWKVQYNCEIFTCDYMWPWVTKPVISVNNLNNLSIDAWFVIIFGWDTTIWISGIWGYQKNVNIEKITFNAMHVTNQILRFDIFTVENVQNIFMEHDLNILMVFGIK